MHLDRTFTNISYIAGEKTVNIDLNGIVELDLVNSSRYYNKIKAVNIKLLSIIGNTVTKSYVWGNIVH